jgi:hypothetical protein
VTLRLQAGAAKQRIIAAIATLGAELGRPRLATVDVLQRALFDGTDGDRGDAEIDCFGNGQIDHVEFYFHFNAGDGSTLGQPSIDMDRPFVSFEGEDVALVLAASLLTSCL